MKVSHEVPISFLDISPEFNDYDYCLPHFLDQYPEYEEYFRNEEQIWYDKLHKFKKYLETGNVLNMIFTSRVVDSSCIKIKNVYKFYNIEEIKSVMNGYGVLILTTPRGIMTDREAKKEKVGGEVLFKIW